MSMKMDGYGLDHSLSFSSPSYSDNYSHIFENSDTAVDVMGNLVSDMSSSHLRSSSVSLSLIDESLGEFSEFHSPLQTFTQLLNDGKQTVLLYDPPCLKLPVLKEACDKKGISRAPSQLKLQLPNYIYANKEATQTMEKPAAEDQSINVIIESECSHALRIKNSRIKSVSDRDKSPASIPRITESSNQGHAVSDHECSHQESVHSWCATSSEKSQKDAPVSCTDFPFSSGHSQTSYQTELNKKRPKRRRAKSCKNTAEVENQRQTHIAVERNRRKQMNEHLSILRSLMPASYVPRGDQASIVGGAIEFVKELEQFLEYLQEKKRRKSLAAALTINSSHLLSDTFHHEQVYCCQSYKTSSPAPYKYADESFFEPLKEIGESRSGIAEIEVQMIGRAAVVKVLSEKKSGQIQKTIAALENLGITIMHTNISTLERTVLYSFNIELQTDCHLRTADEIAVAVQQIFQLIYNSS